jgi:hypothetical protein
MAHAGWGDGRKKSRARKNAGPQKKCRANEARRSLPIADDRLSPSRGEQRRRVTNFDAATDAADV